MSGGSPGTGQGCRANTGDSTAGSVIQTVLRFRLSGCNPRTQGLGLEGVWVPPVCPVLLFAVAEVQVSPAGPIQENQTVTLACNVPEGAPSELRYNWYKNHALLEDAHSRTLQLHAATRADTGFYFCEVQNAQGRERSGPVSVLVIRKWPWSGKHWAKG